MGALSARSQRFLLLSDTNRQARADFVNAYKSEPLRRTSTITCVTTMKKSSPDEYSIDCLVVGAENCRLYCVDTEAFTLLADCSLPSVPVFIQATGINGFISINLSIIYLGLFDVEYRILICCRDGRVYTAKRGASTLTKPTIVLSTHAIGMVRVGKQVWSRNM
jgi:Bardet-Biedl syndrome 1 protein